MIAGKPHIYIVDDSLAFRKVIKTYLGIKNCGIVVGEASNGQELLDVFAGLDIDIILMDLNMPVLNGIETTKIINQKHTDRVKIIGLTQNEEFNYMRSMIQAGAMGYVVKQEMGTQLIKAIETVAKGKIYYPELVK